MNRVMKNKVLFVTAAMSVALFVPKMTALAGDINSAEQGILDALANTYEYDGGYYKVSDGYIAQVSDYLCKDEINLSSEEASSYLAQFYANIGTGIASGYMVKVGDVEKPGSSAGQTQETGAQEDSSGEGQNTENGSADAGNSAGAENGTAAESSGVAAQTAVQTTGAAAQQTASAAGTAKEGNGQIVDNTTGTTQSGKIDYTVVEVDEVMYVWDTETLDVHAEAYIDSDVLGTLHQGDEVQVTGAATTGWAQIKFEDGVGYVSAAYLRTDGYVENKTQEAEKELEEEQKEELKEEAVEEETEDALEETEEQKDYSDAEQPSKSVSMEWVAVIVVAVVVAAAAVVVLRHKRKSRR